MDLVKVVQYDQKQASVLFVSLWTVNPLSPNIHRQILQTDLYTFL